MMIKYKTLAILVLSRRDSLCDPFHHYTSALLCAAPTIHDE